jgi:hypothetical protein
MIFMTMALLSCDLFLAPEIKNSFSVRTQDSSRENLASPFPSRPLLPPRQSFPVRHDHSPRGGRG